MTNRLFQGRRASIQNAILDLIERAISPGLKLFIE